MKIKNSIISIISVALLLFSTAQVEGQINRTLETKVVNALAQMPTTDYAHTERIMKEVMEMGEEGILEFTSRLVPSGQGNDSQVRYLLHSLASYSGGQTAAINQSNLVENAFIKAIEAETDQEVQTFLIRRLAFCGSNSSVAFLSYFLDKEDLFKPALASLTYIGSSQAAAAILQALNNTDDALKQKPFIKALGTLRYAPAVEKLTEISADINRLTAGYALMALAEIASNKSYKTLLKAANASGFLIDDKKSILAYIRYGERLLEKGNTELSTKVGLTLLKKCVTPEQLHFRSAGIVMLTAIEGRGFNPTLIKEVANSDHKYREVVLNAAGSVITEKEFDSWIKTFDNSSKDAKPQIIRMLSKNNNALILDKCIVPSLKSTDEATKIEAIKGLVYQEQSIALDLLLETLQQTTTLNEKNAIELSLLRICAKEDNPTLSASLSGIDDASKVVVVNVLAQREAKSQFTEILGLLDKGNAQLDASVYTSLVHIAGKDDVALLLNLLNTAQGADNIAKVQQAMIKVLDPPTADQSTIILKGFDTSVTKERLLPVLAALESAEALSVVENAAATGTGDEKAIALETLGKWRNNDAIPYLYKVASTAKNENLRAGAFKNYLIQVNASSHPDDQKLLLIKKVLPHHKSVDDKKYVLNASRKVKTFLSLVFVSQFLEDPELIDMASGTAISIALPTPTFKGLSGDVVRDVVSRSINNLTGEDSQYLKIDVKEFLDNMPKEKGYVSIFSGIDLNGWQGLVENPIKRAKMSAASLEKKQTKANAEMANDWSVEDAHIKFVGEGFKNICTVKKYGDFEMLVDWKIGKGGDSGVYLRGTPQVQIWDTDRVEAGAEVGSGGLYNNTSHMDKPLVVADNLVNEWNTFRITMIGDKVTVYLNGQLVVDKTTLENYWDRDLSIFAKEAIELQAHGEDVEFRNVYIKELNNN